MADFVTHNGIRIFDAVGSQCPEQWYIGLQIWPPAAVATYEHHVDFYRHGNPQGVLDAIPTNYIRGTYSARNCTQLLVSMWDHKGFLFEPLIIQGNVDHARLPGCVVSRIMSGVNIRIQSNGPGDFEIQLIGFADDGPLAVASKSRKKDRISVVPEPPQLFELFAR